MSVTPADDSDASGSPVVGDPVLHMAAARALQQLFGRTVAMPRIGRYTLLEQIGAGGMGVVFAAYDDQLDRKVALKLERSTGVADVHRRRRLLREAQTLARLSHPNIVPVFEAGEYEGQIYLTMEFVRGQTVRAWLDHGKPPWQGALAVLLQAGAGLAAAHSAGVVHRDFKPANVLIGEDGRVRVVDFGLARETPDAQAIDEGLAANLTATGALLGTPAYMSAEQFRGLVADARSDQFSFCAVVWEALYGQPAYAVDAAGARRSAVLAGRVSPPPALTRVPRRLQRILTRGLHVDPGRRYPSMNALLTALQPRTARRGGTVAVLVTAGALAGAYALADDAGAVDRCVARAGVQQGEVWNPARRTRLAAALAASGTRDASAIAAHVAAEIDDRTAAWKDMSHETCQASLVERSQSDALFDRRVDCLRLRLQAVDALLRQLEQADAKVAERAVTASDRLPSASECVPEVLLRDTMVPPSDPTSAAEVEGVRAALVDVEASLQTGRITRAVPEAERAAMQARATGHEPVIAEARQLLGAALLARGDVARAREVLRAALTAAETCGHERIAARALIGLAEIAGDDEQQPRDALEQLEVAAAKLARTPDGPVTQATLMRLRATLQWRLGEHDAAIASLTRADVEATAGLGAGDSLVSELRRHLAWMLRTAGRDDEAQRVLAELAQLQPAAAREQAALGDRQAALELELELANEALTAAIQAQGERRPRVAGLLTEIGELDLALGHLAAAGDAFDHALQVLAAQPGNDKAIATANLGQARLALRRGDPAAALRHSRSAYDLRRRAYHDVHGQTMAARLAIADALRAAGDEPAAKLAYGRVLTWVNNQRLIAPEHRALCRGLDLEGSATSPEHSECQRELDAGITRFLARQDADGPEVVGLDASIYLSVPGLVGLDRYPAVPTALYVVDETSARLRLLGEVREGGVAVAVSAIATDPDGVLHGFVYDRDSGTRLVTIDARTTTATPVGAGAPIAQRLTGAAFDPEGTLWVIVQDDKSIREFDLASHTLVGPTLKLPEAPLIGGADLAFDRDGVCYFLGAYTRGYWSTQNSTPLYTCDLVAGTFTSLGRLTGVDFEDNSERQFSPSGLAFSLREDCSEVFMTNDGHGAEEVARIDLGDMTATATGGTVINLATFHWLDLAGYAGPHTFTACAGR